MRILTDVHTHTNASAHAYSTLYENILVAKRKGLELLACTNHGPEMPDAPHWWHFLTFDNIPRVYEGVKILNGAEVNIMDKAGTIDLPENILRDKLDLVIASIHGVLFKDESGCDHTETWLRVIENPYVDILGHSGSPLFPYNIDVIVKAAKDAEKCIEINNHSFDERPNNIPICKEIALACKKYGTNIVVSSDAHFMENIGCFDNAVSMLEEIQFPEELIMNLNADRFINYLSKKKNKKFDFGD